MTPTRSQLDAALPRVPSGIGAMAGDLTDDDERAVALDWLCDLVGKASSYLPTWASTTEEATGRPSVPVRRSTGHTGANPGNWGPPAKGTHESDLECDSAPYIDGETYDTFEAAMLWSKYGRTPEHPPAPGITYHGRDDEK